MAKLKNIVYLSNADYATLVATGTVTIGSTTLTYDEDNNVYITPETYASATEDGIISNSAQTIGGVKTFANGVNAANFNYTGIQTISNNSNVPVWMGTSGANGTPAIDNALLYNPSTNTLTVPNVSGTASNATVAATASKTAGTFTIGSKTFNGSQDVEVKVEDLNLTASMVFKGITTTDVDSNPTATTIVISGTAETAANGWVVLYNNEEFVFDGTEWTRLGLATSFALQNHTHNHISSNGYILSDPADVTSYSGNKVIVSNTAGEIVGGPAVANNSGTYTITGNITGNAGTAGVATKLTNDTVGSSTGPIYLNAGVPTACGGSLAVDITGNAASADALTSGGTFAWANGTTSGPTGSLSLGGVSTTFGAIPSASATQSGVVTTGAQAFAGKKTFNNGIASAGDLDFTNGASNINWNNGTYQQRIQLTDDSTSGTSVFTFQQSTNSGTSYTDLMTIKDDGTVVATKFSGQVEGKSTTAATADKVAHSLTIKSTSSGNTTEGTGIYTFDGSAAKTIDIKADKDIAITAAAGALTIGHGNSAVTAKTAYADTATTASANGGTIKVTDVKYDAYGHVTGSQDRTITLSQVKNTTGSTQDTGKIYLVGAKSQAADAQTYSSSKIYAADSILTAPTFAGALQGNADTATKVNKSITITSDSGTTEGTDKYTFDGSAAKTLNLKSGTNVTLTETAGQIEFSSPSLSGGTASAADTKVISGVTVSGHAVSAAQKTMTAGTGIKITGAAGTITFDHTNSVTAGTIGSTTGSSGTTIVIPYATFDAQGHITGKGTRNHTISAADLGLAKAMIFLGVTTTAMSDGLTTATVTIDGSDVTPSKGSVVLDDDTHYEYVWSGTYWELLGGDSSYKVTQTAKADPTADGNAITFIDTLSQNANGDITATKKTVRDASTSQSGVVSTGTQSFAGAKTFASTVGADALGVSNTSGSTGKGLSLYGGPTSSLPTYGMAFAGAGTYGTHGGVTGDWATYLTMSDTTNRGWIFRRGGTNIASIDGLGVYTGRGINTAFTDGTSTAASASSGTYYPVKWTFNKDLAVRDGLVVTIKTPLAGHDYGVFLSLDNGSTYAPINLNGTGRLTTHYPVGTYITLVYEANGVTNSVYAVAGATARSNITGSWRVINFYDSGNSGLYQNYSAKAYKAGTTAITQYDLVAEDATGLLVPAHKVAHKIGSPIYITDSAIAANATGSWKGLYHTHYNMTIRTSGTNLAATTYNPIYLKGTVSGNTFTPDTTTPYVYTTAGCNVTGAFYMYVGDATGTTTVAYTSAHQYYYYNGSALVPWISTASACIGGAGSAAKLATARNINGTSFDGTADITTAKWGTARTISISDTAGTTGTSIDGSAAASLVVPATMSGFTKITSTNFTGALTGNADTATKFSAAQSVALTGDVTGSASSQAGWSVATTLAASGVTAGSYGPSANASPAHAGTFSVPYITVDAKGRVTAASTKTITLPTDNNTDTKVTQTASTSDADYRLLLSGTANDTTETSSAFKAAKFYANPSTGKLTATTFAGNLVGNVTGNVTGNVSGSSGSCTGNAATATTASACSGNSATATKLATARTLTIGSTGKTFDGSADVSWTLAEIGAAASSHTHSYLPLSGGTMTGLIINSTAKVFGNHDCGTDTAPNNIGWYNVGYSSTMKDGSTPWWGADYYILGINNYWGIDIRTKGVDYLKHNGCRVWSEGMSITGAVWNDYAEYREVETLEAGRCVYEVGDDTMKVSDRRLMRGCEITSDTWGFAEGKTDKAQTPIAVAGRVLAYPYEDREEFKKNIGHAVCSGPNGTVSIMTEQEEKEYPWAIIGTISAIPSYEEWGGGEGADRSSVKVDGRIWIRIR